MVDQGSDRSKVRETCAGCALVRAWALQLSTCGGRPRAVPQAARPHLGLCTRAHATPALTLLPDQGLECICMAGMTAMCHIASL